MLRISTTFLLVATLIGLSGCQQPSANGGRRPIIDFSQRPRLFGGNGDTGNRPAWSVADNTYQFNQQNGTQGWGFPDNQPQIQSNPRQYEQFANLSEQVRSLNNRLGRFDSDNQQLVMELASLKQKLQVANDYNYQLKQQLADTTTQMQQLQVDKSSVEQQLANSQFQLEQMGQNAQALQQQVAQSQQQSPFSQASSGSRVTGATLRANNSLMQKLPQIQVPGAKAHMDGDVIRVEVPTDQLFNPGTYQVNAAHAHLLQDLSQAINQHFPRQIVGIEAHWDNTQIQPATVTPHQVTASQSLAVFDYFTRLGLPKDQMFTMAMGSNRPRYPKGTANNGINANRRVEIVIYPETYDGE